ncbi:DNA-processing protein DprA [Desulfovulcanus sp.]
MEKYSRTEELRACLAMYHIKGLGPKTWKRLLNHFGSPATALNNYEHWLDLGLVRRTVLEAVQDKKWEEQAEQDLKRITQKKYKLVIWTDDDYPYLLKQIPDPPLILYFLGEKNLLKAPCLAVVGSRKCSRYGLDMAKQICRELSANGITIVSGLAHGIDTQAHLAALEERGSSIAVLGTGIDIIYPAQNKSLWEKLTRHGLILTEFPPGTIPEAKNFPYRNRIISGLSLGVLVIQGAQKSGSLITAMLALEQNREVFAIPGAVNMTNYDGCNYLIQQGAFLVQSAADILRELSFLQAGSHTIQTSAKKPVSPQSFQTEFNLNNDEKKVLATLAKENKMHIDQLAFKLDWPTNKLSQILIELEIKGAVKRLPGMYYTA